MWITKSYTNSHSSKRKVYEIGMLQTFLIEREEDLSQTFFQATYIDGLK